MKVIFVKDLKGQGKIGEVKEVKDGYGMNFLVKKGYAVVATEESLSRLKKDNKKYEKLELENLEKAKELKNKLENIELVFGVKTSLQDKVFGSISSKNIISSLKEKGFKVNKNQILLKKPITELGNHKIEIKLYKKVVAQLKIKIITEN